MNMIIHIQQATIHAAPDTQFFSSVEAATLVPEVGQPWPEQGGVLAGIMPAQDGHAAYYLIVPTDAKAEAEALAWGAYGTAIDGLSTWDGKANTALLASAETDHPAAYFCAALEISGFNDFYLPSRREASLMAATVPHLFKPGWHWTSAQYSAGYAFFQYFDDGTQNYDFEDLEGRVRAVRRVIH